MRITFISDTHNKHYELEPMEPADVIVHSGDLTGGGREYEVTDFLEWFSSLTQFKHRIFIAGNHDWLFQEKPELALSLIPKNVIYLQNSEVVIDDIKFYGSPVQPYFHGWAFNEKGSDIIPFWENIPLDTDILITHGPPHLILDSCKPDGYRAGCVFLRQYVEKIKPKVHVFGHIHESNGIYNNGETTFINASVLNERYSLSNEPITINITNE
jgi:Icc-related predicted phosphoesterase